jgi:2-amino-4-hydroxy-6-hydroxymethyldihydropteridine diphosphokinase
VNAEHHIRGAVRALINSFGDAEISPVYRSRSVGFEGGDFINLAARIQTAFKPGELRQYLRNLEDRYGLNRAAPKWSDRTLDIDILLFDDLVIRTDELVLPRTDILRFAHVLKPLVDIAPDLEHPIEGKTYAELWAQGDWEEAKLELLDPAFISD